MSAAAAAAAGGALESESSNTQEIGRRLLSKTGKPVLEPVTATLDMLLKEGRRLCLEQDRVNEQRLSEDYMKGVSWTKGGGSLIGFGS
jgi:hypothetical protein